MYGAELYGITLVQLLVLRVILVYKDLQVLKELPVHRVQLGQMVFKE
jgi:hypothetical protein